MKVPYIINDLVIKEDSCNLSCKYCLTGQSWFSEQHTSYDIFNPPHIFSCLPGTSLHNRLNRIVEASIKAQVPIIKLSGGEILLIKGILEFIENISGHFEKIVILTNGMLLSKLKLEKLKSLGNVVLQLSLDSVTFYGNSYRVQSEKLHKKLLEGVFSALSYNIPTEIYSVINNRSIDTLQTSLQEFKAYSGNLTLFPFPVRGPLKDKFFPKEEQFNQIKRLVDNFDEYASILPHKKYLLRLSRFFYEGSRCFSCHLPRIAFSSFDDGTVTSCPNIWFNHVGNLLEENDDIVFGKLSKSLFKQLLLARVPRIQACRTCFTPWDPVSLYFEDEIDLQELIKIPIYQGDKTRKMLEVSKNEYKNSMKV